MLKTWGDFERYDDDYVLSEEEELEIKLQEIDADTLYASPIDPKVIQHIMVNLINYLKQKQINGMGKFHPDTEHNKKISKITPKQIENIIKLYEGNQITVAKICNMYHISRTEFYKYISIKKDKFCEPPKQAIPLVRSHYHGVRH